MEASVIAGPQLFLRYAFMPNRLGYCGGEDNRALLEYGLNGQVDAGLIKLEEQFEGAYPYLLLIAHANRIADPFDHRVVEAYWIGNRFLDGVDLGSFYDSLAQRFRGRMPQQEWIWLAGKVPAGAVPHHSFHVFEVYSRTGLMRSGLRDRLLETMQNCLVRWGRVGAVLGEHLIVEAPVLKIQEGRLSLDVTQTETVQCSLDGKSLIGDIAAGDWISIHWGWACDRLLPEQIENLRYYTLRHLLLCNQTI